MGCAIVPSSLREPLWVTREKPAAIIALAGRIAARGGGDVVVTKLAWRSTQLALHLPQSPVLIVSEWSEDRIVARAIASLSDPFLLVTQPGDEAHVARFETIVGRPLVRRRVDGEGAITVDRVSFVAAPTRATDRTPVTPAESSLGSSDVGRRGKDGDASAPAPGSRARTLEAQD